MEEYFFVCPYCAQSISMLLDLSVRGQTYIEDCEVCCRPVEISYTVTKNQVDEFNAQTTDS